MRNMNSADKVDDDACHKEKSAENNVSHDIAWGMWCSFRLYGGIQFQVKTTYTVYDACDMSKRKICRKQCLS